MGENSLHSKGKSGWIDGRLEKSLGRNYSRSKKNRGLHFKNCSLLCAGNKAFDLEEAMGREAWEQG